jgi:hypothetical protein
MEVNEKDMGHPVYIYNNIFIEDGVNEQGNI